MGSSANGTMTKEANPYLYHENKLTIRSTISISVRNPVVAIIFFVVLATLCCSCSASCCLSSHQLVLKTCTLQASDSLKRVLNMLIVGR